jgi:hypothetical protein
MWDDGAMTGEAAFIEYGKRFEAEIERLRAENARLRAHVDECPYGPLGEEWWCTHIPRHEDGCYEEDGNTVKVVDFGGQFLAPGVYWHASGILRTDD